MRVARRNVIAACVLRRECLTARRRFTPSKGDYLLHEAWQKAKSALWQVIKKSRLQCWKDLIGEVEKDPWGLAYKIVTKRLVTRRKTPSVDNPDRVKYIVRCLNPHVESFLSLKPIGGSVVGALVRERGFLVLTGMPRPVLGESCTTSSKDFAIFPN